MITATVIAAILASKQIKSAPYGYSPNGPPPLLNPIPDTSINPMPPGSYGQPMPVYPNPSIPYQNNMPIPTPGGYGPPAGNFESLMI